MRKTAVLRFVVFVAVHVMLCVFAVQYAGEYSAGVSVAESPESGVYVDGTDFTAIFSLMSDSVNGAFSVFMAVVYFGVMTVLSVIFLLPFRFMAVKKYSAITRGENNATLAVIVAGAVLAALAALIFYGMEAVPMCLLFLLPTLLIEMLLYWLTLYFRCKK